MELNSTNAFHTANSAWIETEGKCISASVWQGKHVPERLWLVENWMPLFTTTALYGDGGTGKSLLAQQLMTCAVAGLKFMGLCTMTVPALGIFCEDDADELHRRQSAINTHYGIGYEALANMHVWSRVGEDNALIGLDDKSRLRPTPFFNEIRERAIKLAAKLIVIDTAADTFVGNENNRQEVRYFIQLLNGLAYDIGGTVVLCCHPSVYGINSGTGGGGSTAWSNAVRSRLYLERGNPDNNAYTDNNIRTLTRKKANYAEINDAIILCWDSGIFRVKLTASKDAVDRIEERVRMKAFLIAMRKLEDEGRSLSVSKQAGNYAPKLIKEKIPQYSFKQLEAAMSKLLHDGNIKNESYGPRSKNFKKLSIIKDLENDV